MNLDQIKRRAEKATPGPWERDTNLPFSLEFMGIFAPGEERYIIRAQDDREDPTTRDDAEFIAHAREDIPALLAALDQIAALCDQTDIETYEATQAWLVGNIRAVLASNVVRPEHDEKCEADSTGSPGVFGPCRCAERAVVRPDGSE